MRRPHFTGAAKRPALLLALTVLAATPPFLVDLPAHPYHVDEYFWVHSSCYHRLLATGGPRIPAVHVSAPEADVVPPIANLVIGLGVDVAGCDVERGAHQLPFWWEKNQHLPEKNPGIQPRLLLCARTTCALFGLGAALLMFLIGYLTAGPLAGVLMSLLFAYSPLVLLVSRRAMVEGPLLFFIGAAVLIQVYFFSHLRESRRKLGRIACFALAEGVCLGCVVGTKLTGALVAVAFVVTMSALSVLELRRGSRSPGRGRAPAREPSRLAASLTPLAIALVVGVVAFAFFVCAKPSLCGAPISGFVQLVRDNAANAATAHRSFPERALNTLGERAKAMLRMTCTGRAVSFPRLLTRWGHTLLFFLGFLLLATGEIRSLLKGQPTAKLPVLIWIATSFACVTLWLPVDWDRYFTPLAPCVCYLVGLSLAEAATAVRRTCANVAARRSQP